METYLTLRRDDFVKLSDGSTMFDSVLSALNIDEAFQSEIHEVSIEINEHTLFKMWDENGKRRVRKYDPNTKMTKLDILDERCLRP